MRICKPKRVISKRILESLKGIPTGSIVHIERGFYRDQTRVYIGRLDEIIIETAILVVHCGKFLQKKYFLEGQEQIFDLDQKTTFKISGINLIARPGSFETYVRKPNGH